MSWLSDIKLCLSSLSRRVTIIEEGGVGPGGDVDFASPPPIGNVAPNTGKFTTLQATSGLNVSGGTMAFNTTTITFGTGSASAFRTALGLGSLATQSGTFSGVSSGTNTGDQTITLTGEVTGSGTGSFATAISATTVTGKALTGYVSGSGAITSSDSILTAINKLNGNTALKANLASPTFTGTVSGTFSGPLTGNVTGNVSGAAANFTGLLSGDVTGTQSATSIAATTVTGKVLTGYLSGAGTVAATDSILAAINKLNGNTALKANTSSLGTLATLSPTGTPSSTTYLRGDNTWATVTGSGGFIGTPNRIIVGASGTNVDSSLETTLANTGVNASINSVVLNVPTAVGTTHTNLVLTPKGTSGSIIFGPVPDGTAFGGNARGAGCLDLQITRSAASQVTRYTNGLAIGGGNTTDPSYANSTAIGWSNTCTGGNSLAVGSFNQALSSSGFAFGQANQLSGTSSMAFGYGNFAQPGLVSGNVGIAIGYGNKSNGNNTVTLGLSCEALGALSFAYGVGAISTRIGQHSGATGNFSANGDCQRVNFLLRKKIENSAAATELALDGASTYLTIPSGKGMAFVVHVYGMKSDGSVWAYFIRKGAIRNSGSSGTTALVNPVSTLGTDDNFYSVPAPIITANDGLDYLSIMVTNPTGSEIWRWMAHVEGVEMAYGI